MTSQFVLLLVFESIGGIFFFKRKREMEIEDGIDEDQDNFLCKFVTDGSGRKIGESVSIDDDVLIIKSKGRFLGVPLKHIEDKGKTLLVKGLVDLDKAYEMGEQWRSTSFDTEDETDNEEE